MIYKVYACSASTSVDTTHARTVKLRPFRQAEKVSYDELTKYKKKTNEAKMALHKRRPFNIYSTHTIQQRWLSLQQRCMGEAEKQKNIQLKV